MSISLINKILRDLSFSSNKEIKTLEFFSFSFTVKKSMTQLGLEVVIPDSSSLGMCLLSVLPL